MNVLLWLLGRGLGGPHWLSNACWPIAFPDVLAGGTDSGSVWLRLTAAAHPPTR